MCHKWKLYKAQGENATRNTKKKKKSEEKQKIAEKRQKSEILEVRRNE